MSPAKSWAIVAAQPPLTAAALGLRLNERLAWLLRCEYRVPHWLEYVTLACCVLMLSALIALLMLALEAARNRRHGLLKRLAWVLGLLVASPLTAPLYWAMYLRGRN